MATRCVPGVGWDAATCFSTASGAGFGVERVSASREARVVYIGYFKLTLTLLSVFVRK